MVMNTFLFIYGAIGLVIVILVDMGIRNIQSSEPFTFKELIVGVVFWPIIVYQLIREIIRHL